jgi:putative phosphoribosyl transferase
MFSTASPRQRTRREFTKEKAGMKAGLHEIKENRNRRFVFKNRDIAGRVLGHMLAREYGGEKNVMVLAIPSGGIPVALAVRQKLKCAFDLLIVRKLQIPGNPEAGFGALTQEGTVFLNEGLLSELRLTPDHIENERKRVGVELDTRNRLFRGGRAFPDLEDKRVILVDDGLASGYTMVASLFEARKKGAAELVVAVPTAPLDSIRRIENGADKIYCANIREGPFFAVAEAYENWYDLSPEEALKLLHKRADRNE